MENFTPKKKIGQKLNRYEFVHYTKVHMGFIKEVMLL